LSDGSDQPNQANADAQLAQAMDLFARHQRRLRLYIQAIIPSPADADEVLQETNVVIWKKYEQFDPDAPGSDFLSWAIRIAQYQALDYRRRRGRQMLSLSPEVLDQVAAVLTRDEPLLERRRDALRTCLDKLPEEDRTLIERSYAPDANVNQIAASLQRKTTSVYRSLRRVRRILAECIDNQLASES